MIKTDLSTQSIREKIYIDLCNRLMKLTSPGGKPIIEAIDLWNNQWQYLDKEKPFNFPCVFIEFASISWMQLGEHTQQGSLVINLHIGSKCNAPSRHGAVMQDKWLHHLRVIDAIHLVLSGWGNETGYMGSLTRLSSQHDHDHDDIIAHVETYKFTIKDLSAVTDWIKLDGDKFVIERQ